MKHKNLTYFFIVVVILVIQASVLPTLLSWRPLPNLILVLAIVLTIILGFQSALPWLVGAGLLSDLFYYDLPGSGMILLVIFAYFVSFVSRRFLVENKIWGVIVMVFFVVAATFVQHAPRLLIFTSSDNFIFSETFTFLGQSVFLQVILNILAFFVFFKLVKKVEKIKIMTAIR